MLSRLHAGVVKSSRRAADPVVVPQQPSHLSPAVRVLVTVLLFVPIWYGFMYASGLTLVIGMLWTVMAPLVLRDVWFEINHHDALTAAVDPHRQVSSHRR